METPRENLPAYASVVVIGGGVMGCSTLYHLAKDGATDAILLERNKLTSGTTWHSAAQVRALRSTAGGIRSGAVSIRSTRTSNSAPAAWINARAQVRVLRML